MPKHLIFGTSGSVRAFLPTKPTPLSKKTSKMENKIKERISEVDDLLALWKRGRKGDRREFERVFKECNRILHRCVIKQIKRVKHINYQSLLYEDAEELVAETMLRVWASKEKFRGESSLISWIFAISRGVIGDKMREYHRQDKVFFWTAGSDDDLEQWVNLIEAVPADQPFIEEVIEDEQTIDALSECLSALPGKYQMHWEGVERSILEIFEHMTTEKLADLLARPYETVKSQLTRARALTRQCIEKKGIGYWTFIR
jgi:RNA polymerase sigma-70 factor (ECF subfamily)